MQNISHIAKNFSLAKREIRFLLLEGVHQSAVDALACDGYDGIDYVPHALSDNELKDKISSAHFVGIRSRTQLDASILEAATKLVAIGCFCIGTNQIDLKVATDKGIAVFNAPYANTRSVAELVLGHAISLLRGIPEKNNQMHHGIWKKSANNAYEIRGKALGIVGYGNIGSQLSILAESLGMTVYFYDVAKKLPLGNAKQLSSLADLLKHSDVVTLHVPADSQTDQMINNAELALMKERSILINLSRGNVVNIDALTDVMKSGKLLGAAVDVFPQEPTTNGESFISPLTTLNNVILTPHIGGSTQEAQQNIGLEVIEKLIQYSNNGTSISSVNFPEVSLPSHEGRHRILHIHKNMPGVMSAINTLLSNYNINISGQYLQTNEKIGYVVTDMDAAHSGRVFSKLREIKGTLHCRVLY